MRAESSAMRLPNWIQVGRGWRRRRRSREGCWLFHGYMVHAVLDGAVRGRGGPGSAIVDVRGPHIGVEAASAHVRLLVRAILAWIGAGPKWAAKAVSNLFWGALRVGICCGNYQSRTLGRGIGVSVRKRSHRPARHFCHPCASIVLQTRSCPSDSLNTRPTPNLLPPSSRDDENNHFETSGTSFRDSRPYTPESGSPHFSHKRTAAGT